MSSAPLLPLLLALAGQLQDATEIMARSVQAARVNREKFQVDSELLYDEALSSR